MYRNDNKHIPYLKTELNTFIGFENNVSSMGIYVHEEGRFSKDTMGVHSWKNRWMGRSSSKGLYRWRRGVRCETMKISLTFSLTFLLLFSSLFLREKPKENVLIFSLAFSFLFFLSSKLRKIVFLNINLQLYVGKKCFGVFLVLRLTFEH